eukprot:CAMPEP_0197553248 /NCGR_PEP_ID=MMETSP1320-20131121/8545_1 /TAXON_ID=91990 /ORGANISM="Bolidomonas sp., Strain RCC2347" /LENGTH=240 /DNA_ID=CAMNT_0043113979 /DNA_START=98 /DNA_END=820 /DNA_ORIENTATION=-
MSSSLENLGSPSPRGPLTSSSGGGSKSSKNSGLDGAEGAGGGEDEGGGVFFAGLALSVFFGQAWATAGASATAISFRFSFSFSFSLSLSLSFSLPTSASSATTAFRALSCDALRRFILAIIVCLYASSFHLCFRLFEIFLLTSRLGLSSPFSALIVIWRSRKTGSCQRRFKDSDIFTRVTAPRFAAAALRDARKAASLSSLKVVFDHFIFIASLIFSLTSSESGPPLFDFAPSSFLGFGT